MSDSGPGRREVAYRLFAAEFDDAEFSYSESDEERAPNYVVTPTGARVNRLFAVGVLTEVEDVNPEMVRGRVVDPTGAFVTYAGQYQPDALAFLERADPPTFIALSGKARTFEPDDGDRIYTSVRPESVSEVDAETRDRAAVVAAERTLERVGVMASAIESGLEGDRLRAALEAAGVDERLADGVALALDYYGTTPAYLEALRELAVDVARVVAGEREEVRSLDAAPGEGMGDAAALASLDLSDVSIPEPAATDAGASDESEPAIATEGGDQEVGDADVGDSDVPDAAVGDEDEATAGSPTPESPTTADPDVETDAGTATGTQAATGAEPDETTTGSAEPDAGAVSGTDRAPADPDEAAAGGDDEPATASEAGSQTDGPESAAVDEPGDFEPGEYELDEEERRAVEEEHGTEFSTADEIEDADAGSPEPSAEADEASGAAAEPEPETEPAAEPDTEPEPASESEPEPASESEPEPASESETAAEPEAAAEAAGDVDLEDAVVRTMEELDDGDGADQEAVVASVVEEHGVDPDDVEDAVQDALMSGRCYEPADGTLKSI